MDAVGAVVVERLHARLALGLARDALAPGLGVADQHGQLRPRVALEPEQGDEPNRLGAAVDHDRPLAIAASVHRPLDPSSGVVRA